MEKLKPTLKNMTLVLVIVAVVVGVILAFVNHITEGPIKAKAAQTLAAGIKTVMHSDNLKVGDDICFSNDEDGDGRKEDYVIHPCADSNGKALGAAVESTTTGFGGDLKVLVGFDPQGKILGYTILETAETPGLGMKAGDWFQKGGKGDIIGKSPADKQLQVSKDGGDVDAITASTITSRAFLKAVNQAYQAYKSNK